MSKKISFAVLTISIMVILCCGCLIAGYFWYRQSHPSLSDMQELHDIKIEMDYPSSIRSGESFSLNIHVTNLSSQPQMLDSIDLYSTYLDGFQLTGSDPVFLKAIIAAPGVQYQEYTAHYFKQNIEANEELVVRFFLTAERPASYHGLIFICVNSPTLCNPYILSTEILEQNQSG